MITTTQTRTRGSEPTFKPDVLERSQAAALDLLLTYELGFGGQVVDLDYEEGRGGLVVTITRVMDCIDRTTSVGTAKEMKPLCQLAGLHLQLEVNRKGNISEAAIEEVMAITKGNPLLIKLGGDFSVGQHALLRDLLILATGNEARQAELRNLRLTDLTTSVLMAYSGECSIEEAIELAL